MTGRLVSICLCLALSSSGASAQTSLNPPAAGSMKTTPATVEEPRDIIASLYKLAAVELKKAKGTSPFYDRKVRERSFSKGFDLLITAAETKAAHEGDAILDFDPVSASQDAELQKVTLKTDVLELGKAVVSASFLNHRQATVVTYDFLQEEGGWKINDIKGTTEKEAWSVRKILKTSGKQPTALPGMPDAKSAPDGEPVPPKKDAPAN